MNSDDTDTTDTSSPRTDEIHRLPEWRFEKIPRNVPYIPQIEDEVIFFRQCYQLYLKAVQQKNVYKLPPNYEPWADIDLQDVEYVKVIDIEYEIQPQGLCSLVLQRKNFGYSTLSIKLHVMENVKDFVMSFSF